jgi:sirohydrochlorin ferrochelatase
MTKIVRAIVRYFKKRFAGAQIKVRLLAIAAFAIFAFLGGNDAVDIAKSISNPETTANTLGVTTQESTLRAVIVLLLSAVICVASLATIVGAMQRTTLLRGWIVVTVTYVLYALYHLSFAIVQMHGSQIQAFIPGAVYLCLAAAAYSFGRQASRALDPVVH